MIPLFKVFMNPDAKKDVGTVLDSGYIGQGPKVDEFEYKLKEVFDNDFVLTTNSATSAEHLALYLLKKSRDGWKGLNDGDEVLATPLTCTATNFPILANNFKLKWVDVDLETLNMDLDDLARKITPTTKAIMLVHWGGYPVDLDRVKEIQKEAYRIYGFKPAILEDCAHAFGSKYKGNPIGSHGNLCTFSFQAIKHLTSVDGGALVLPHEELYTRGKLLRWYGINRETNQKDFRCESDIKEWGFKFHMNDINATIGMSNLSVVEKEVVQKHKDNAKYYNNHLKNIPGVTLLKNEKGWESAYWIYTIKVDNRDSFMNFMKEKEIVVSRVHERNDLHTCVREYSSLLPNLEKVVNEMICIPVGWWVSNKDRKYIVDSIKEWSALHAS
jgi:dTDP-4-amino-4,6-dideoxygalactose transaminase